MKKFLRHKVDGEIFYWSPALATHPLLEEVTEQEAYPERFASAKVIERIGNPPVIDLSVPENVQSPPPEVNHDLAAQVTANTARKVSSPRAKKPQQSTGDLAGLMESL